MGRKEELAAKNTPIDGKQFRFYLSDRLYNCIILDLVDAGKFSGDNFSFTIVTTEGNYQLSAPVNESSTNESLYNTLEVVYPEGITGLDTDYFNVIYYLSKIYILLKVDGLTFIPDFDETAMSDTDSTYQVTNELKYAPDGWDSDEFTLKRDLKSFGVFRKFASGELKFVKDGRDNILTSYEETGVNTDKTLTVTENTSTGAVRTRFVGKIDHSTLKRTEITADVAVIDGSFTDLVLSRANMEVNLLGSKSVDGAAISALSLTDITIPEINIVEVGTWEEHSTSEILTESHSLQVDVINSEYPEGQSTSGFLFGKFFDTATEDYLASVFEFNIQAEANGDIGSAHFTWVFHLDRWAGGIVTEADIYTSIHETTGSFPMVIDIQDSIVLDINTGDSLVFRAELIPDIGNGDIKYSAIDFKLTTQIESIPERGARGILYHEAFDRIIEVLTGNSGRFKSDFLGRTDLGYSADGQIGAFFGGRYIRGQKGLNNTIAMSLTSAFGSMQSVFNLGMGIETIGGVEKVVIEPMSYFFTSVVALNISNRIASETIEKEYYPELSFNRIAVGFNSYEYKSLGGIYEFNTTSKFTTPIKPVDKELNLIAPYRADMSGVLELIKEQAENKDIQGEEDIFILDTIRNGDGFIVRTLQGFEQSEDLSNRDTLFNVLYSPERNLIRWGSYIRGFCEKDKTKSLIWQTSDKNTKLKSTVTGGTEVAENSDVLISSLTDPLWHPEILTFEVPALETDIDVIQENKYGLIQCAESEYGWIIDYKSKNENKKSEFTLLRCNTDYVTPVGDPVFPATLKVQKNVTNAPVDYTVFHINVIGDNGVEYLNVPILANDGVIFRNIPYGTYTVTEVDELGYTLVGITPATVTIDFDNLQQIVVIENAKDPIIENIKFGALYNWYAATDARNICSDGWDIPTLDQITDLYNYAGGFGVAGYTLSIDDDEFWNTPNFGTNLYGFGAKGGGVRYGNNGTFGAFKIYSFIWSKDEFVWDNSMAYALGPFAYNYDTCEVSADDKQSGHYLRPVKVLTSLSEGETGTYIGNDGKVYPTRCINGIEWLADNLNETKYRNGDLIPVVTDNAAWAALTTGARCSYNNDDSNL